MKLQELREKANVRNEAIILSLMKDIKDSCFTDAKNPKLDHRSALENIGKLIETFGHLMIEDLVESGCGPEFLKELKRVNRFIEAHK